MNNIPAYKMSVNTLEPFEFDTLTDTSQRFNDPVEWVKESVKALCVLFLAYPSTEFGKLSQQDHEQTLLKALKSVEHKLSRMYIFDETYASVDDVTTLHDWYYHNLMDFIFSPHFNIIKKEWEQPTKQQTGRKLLEWRQEGVSRLIGEAIDQAKPA